MFNHKYFQLLYGIFKCSSILYETNKFILMQEHKKYVSIACLYSEIGRNIDKINERLDNFKLEVDKNEFLVQKKEIHKEILDLQFKLYGKHEDIKFLRALNLQKNLFITFKQLETEIYCLFQKSKKLNIVFNVE